MAPHLCKAKAAEIGDTGSEYASEGTRAHDAAEKLLKGEDYTTDNEEMERHVTSFAEFAQSITTEDDTTYIEKKVPLFYSPGETGTIDYAAVSSDRIYVLDLKYGKGVSVDAENNKQLAIYARSLVDLYREIYEWEDNAQITIAIYQPRSQQGDAELPLKVWSLTLADLIEFTDPIGKTAEAIMNHDGLTYKPSESACRFCAARGLCVARKEWVLKQGGFENLDDLTETAQGNVDTKAMSPEEIMQVFTSRKLIAKWMDEVLEAVQKQILNGVPVEGLKVVAGKPGNRTWKTVESAEVFLKGQKLKNDERYKKSLISPTQAEKLLKEKLKESTRARNAFDRLITRKEGAPALAPADDERPDLMATAADTMNNEEEDDPFA